MDDCRWMAMRIVCLVVGKFAPYVDRWMNALLLLLSMLLLPTGNGSC